MKAIILLLAIFCSTAAAADHTIEITYYVASQHFEDGLNDGRDYNAVHNFIGLEYRTGRHGFAVSAFKNSYYNPATLTSYAYYYAPAEFIETSARIGVTTGYDGVDECGGQTRRTLCPFASLEVAYTKFDLVVPKLSLIPGAVTLSFSARF